MSQPENTALVHLYAQEIWNDDAYIIGTEDGLKKLRDAIDEALKDGHMQQVDLYTADGSEYTANIVLNNENPTSKAWKKLKLPYTDELAQEAKEAEERIYEPKTLILLQESR